MSRQNIIHCFLFILLSFTGAGVFAAIDVVEFESETLRKQYQKLTEELRCPKCPNQNLIGTNSPIAYDLRREVARLLKEGQSEAQIKTYMVNRYGEFVLYEPPVDKNTIFLWFSPIIFLGIAFIIFGVVVYKRSRLLAKNRDAGDSAER